MGVPCTPSDLVAAAKCFNCIPKSARWTVRTKILCETAVKADPTGTCVAPTAPTLAGLTRGEGFPGDLQATWKQPKNTGSFIIGYKVFWGTTAGGPYTSNSGLLPIVPRVYLITGLTPGVTYYVVVQAIGAVSGCNSVNSNQLSNAPAGPANGLLNNLVHYYQLTEAVAPFADSGSGAFPLSWSNAGADFSQAVGHVQATAAQYSGAGGVNAITSIVAAPFDFTGDSTGNTSMTYACWFNLNAVQPNAFGPIFSLWGAAAAQEAFLLRRDAANQVGWYGKDKTGVTVQLTPIAATDGAWHLFVGGHDQVNQVWWYQIDNNARVTTPQTGLQSMNNTAVDVFNWAAGGANELAGIVSDFGVWNNRVLSTTDISNLWNGGAGLAFSKFTP